MNNAIVPFSMPSVPTPDIIQAVDALVRKAVQSGMAKTKRPEDAFFIVMYGLELGIPPMTALRTIYSVNGGAPTCSGEAMLALIRRSGKVRVTISSTDETLKADKATVSMKRLDTGDEFTATWGKADDNRAGLRNNRDKYPAQMWTWRAVSIAGKALCSDIIGALYTFEEINPNIPVDDSGAPTVDLTQLPGDVTEGEFTEQPETEEAKKKLGQNGQNRIPQPETEPRPKWATPENLEALKGVLAKNDIQWSDIPGLAEAISDPNNWQQWEAFASSGKTAVQGLIGLRNKQLENSKPATPKNAPAPEAAPADFMEKITYDPKIIASGSNTVPAASFLHKSNIGKVKAAVQRFYMEGEKLNTFHMNGSICKYLNSDVLTIEMDTDKAIAVITQMKEAEASKELEGDQVPF